MRGSILQRRLATVLPVIMGGQSYPTYLSGEIGAVDEYTVVVTFSRGVLSSVYAVGVTINKGGVGQTIDSATRQADTRIVHYVLHDAAAGGDSLTWAYNAAVGDYSNLDGSKPMATQAATALTNNIGGAAAPALDFSVAANSMYLAIVGG